MITSRRHKSIFSRVLSKSKIRNTLFKEYRTFNLIFLELTLVSLVSIGLFNITIDPYDIFDTPDILGINHTKPKKDNNDRLFKAVDVTRIKPVTIFLGSSRVKRALDPSHPTLSDLQPAYNLGINGPNSYELRRYLEHAIANQKKLKRSYI